MSKRQQKFSIDLSRSNSLTSRGEPRRYKTNVDQVSKLEIYSLDYPSNSDLYTSGDVPNAYRVRVDWKTAKPGDDTVKALTSLPEQGVYTGLVTEHLIEVSLPTLHATVSYTYFFESYKQ